MRVEILAPAGSYESMTAAIAAGADAVYIGGSRFGARAYADNPQEDTLLSAIDYAHLHGVKLYMTVNTLLKESEIGQLVDYLMPYYLRGVDAVIVQDMGAFSLIRKSFPDLPIHASTQMTVTGTYGAKLLAELGATRIVPARELSLLEIEAMHRESGLEIECFVHGALCYSYSGQCLYSSLVGGRSGNRGRCAQPCRLPYDVSDEGKRLNAGTERYVMSLKDLCTLDLIPDMIEAGIDSFKIEGRMKSPRYTAGVTSIYRRYVDLYMEKGRRGYAVAEKDKKMLLELFDRGGFTNGYYQQQNGKDMVALKEKPEFREGNQQLFEYLDQRYVNSKHQEKIEGRVSLTLGAPSALTIQYRELSVTVNGEVPTEAKNQPISEEKLRKQINKTGNSPFLFNALTVDIEGDLFLPLQAINELRRNGLEVLEQAILKPYHRSEAKSWHPKEIVLAETGSVGKEIEPTQAVQMNVSVETIGQLRAALSQPEISVIYLDSSEFLAKQWRDAVQKCHEAGKSCYLVLPHIFRKKAEEYFLKHMLLLKEAGFDGLILRSMEEVIFLREEQVKLLQVFDYGLYVMNRPAKHMMKTLGAGRITLPVELNSRELANLGCEGSELILYGHLPMMVSAQCMRKTTSVCDKTHALLWMKDRKGKEFPVKNHCVFCYNTVYNTSPLSLIGQEEIIWKLKPAVLRLQFSVETESETKEIVSAFADCFMNRHFIEQPQKDFTKGHFKRGVE